MNFIQIMKRLEAYSISLPYVNEVNLGDVYEYLNGNPNVKYASVNIDINNSVRNDNLISYSVYLYYIDRLTEDKSNWMEVKTTAELTLNSIINYAAKIGDVNDGWTINYFEQQFADYCAGGYVQFNLEVPNVMGDCLIDEYEEGEIVYPDYPEHKIIDDDVIVKDKTWSSFKINEELNNKQDKLIAGDNITIENNVISATGGSSDDCIKQGSNDLSKDLKFYGKDNVSNVTIKNDHADLTGNSLHKDSTSSLFDRGIGYNFTPDKIVFQNYTTDSDGNIGAVTTEYKQTTKNIELGAEKVIINPTSAFAVNGAMTVTATDKAAKFDTKTFESKVQNTFTIKDAGSNKLFETKAGQTKINTRLDVIEPERGNSLKLKKDGFETIVYNSDHRANWMEMTAGGNPFTFGAVLDSNIDDNFKIKTAFLNTLPDGRIYIYDVDGYDGISTAGHRSLQNVISDLESDVSNIIGDITDLQDDITDLQDNKQDTLVAGTGINISGNVISAGGEVDILTKNAQIRITVTDFTRYDVISIFVSTSVDRYLIFQYKNTALGPRDAIELPFDFDIQYTNADPRVNVMVYNSGSSDAVGMGYFWVAYDTFMNNTNQIMPTGFWIPSNANLIQWRGFSVIGNLKNYDLNRDGRIELFRVQTSTMCYAEDTLITLSDGTTKKVQDITYDDILKVWNFDEGKSDSAKPILIKVEQTANQYALVKLSDGNSIKLVGTDGKYHCMYDMDEQKFNHAIDCVGHNVYTENGIVKVESLEIVNEPVKFYNIVTNVHLNCYANHILTSTEKNNIYPINDMKFVKDNREFKPYEAFKDYGISLDEYEGWRLAEQPMSVEECIKFVKQRKQTQL